MKKSFKFDFKGNPLIIEVNDLASQANSSILLKYQETVVLVTTVIGLKNLPHLDFLPLSVEYEEKFYAAGKIGGSRFIRRETRPSEEATLTARLIDRSLRPLFPKNLRREIQIVATVLSLGDFDPDFLSLFGASLAVSLSEIPWFGPVAGIRIAKNEKEIKINPDFAFREKGKIDLFLTGLVDDNSELINMIEVKSAEAKEEEIISLFEKSLPEIRFLLKKQEEIIEEIKPKKNKGLLLEPPKEAEEKVLSFLKKEGGNFPIIPQKEKKESQFSILKQNLLEEFKEKGRSEEEIAWASFLFEREATKILEKMILKKNQRPDGRGIKEIREISGEVSLLPRIHGSGLFKRGLTHILSTVTLASPSEQLRVETIEFSGTKRFIHHYNFPPYCVGEIGSLRRPPSRREIGHGALVEKALENVIPSEEDFPYAIRVVSEVLSSNGSSSMASVCASSLALMDAGVPIKRPVAGIALGLVGDLEKAYKILTDIQGPEDHYGLMDFKVAGTEKGITAIQLDVKNFGLNLRVIKESLEQGKEARKFILGKMKKVLSGPRKTISPYAPKIVMISIPKEKIGLLIGPGGRTIQNLIREYDLEAIDIDDEEGKVFVSGREEESVKEAIRSIRSLVLDYQPGDIIKGKVVKILDFGAIIQLDKFHTGLLHISEISKRRIKSVSDVLKEGQIVKVKVIRVEEDGKIALSMKNI